jgi:hypothetical protein
MEKGFDAGMTQKGMEVAKTLLEQTDFDTEKVANLAGVSLAVIEKVKASISKT